MDATRKIQVGIHGLSLDHKSMCPGNWVHINCPGCPPVWNTGVGGALEELQIKGGIYMAIRIIKEKYVQCAEEQQKCFFLVMLNKGTSVQIN